MVPVCCLENPSTPEQTPKTTPRYNYTVDSFRDAEYPMLKGKTYLDHAGTTLYARSLIEAFATDLATNLYGNPHSNSTPSVLSSARVEEVRRRALHFLNADPEHFDLIFVANATAAIKMVMESFRDLASASTDCESGPGHFWFGYHRDAHTSIVGVRETTKQHHCFHDDQEVERWLAGGKSEGRPLSLAAGRLGLFAYPGQSNMTGRRLPLSWPGRLRKSAQGDYTYSLLDAAALATTAPINLSDVDTAPDFTALSFYKIFGFPNLGALVVRKNSGHILQWRKYFGGGTVDMVVCIKEAWHARKDYTTDNQYSLHDQLEDGTLPFHSIFALGAALDVHVRLYGSMQNISTHTAFLGRQLYEGLSAIKHANGRPLCRIYKDDSATYGDTTTQGATLAFNVQHVDGSLVPYTQVEQLADQRHIHLRSGGLCNPGGIATYLGLEPWEMKRAFSAGHRCGHATEVVSGKPTGVVRVSVGAMSTMSDVDIFLDFMRGCFVETSSSVPQQERLLFLPPLQDDPRVAKGVTLHPKLSTKHVSCSGDAAAPFHLMALTSKQPLAATTFWIPDSSPALGGSVVGGKAATVVEYEVEEQQGTETHVPLAGGEGRKVRSSKSLANIFAKSLKSKKRGVRADVAPV